MPENPYQSPVAKTTRTKPLLALLLHIVAVPPGLLALLMTVAGIRWLIIEHEQDIPHSLSLALLSGAAISTIITGGIVWLATRVARKSSAREAD
jgi:hypothetical protein